MQEDVLLACLQTDRLVDVHLDGRGLRAVFGRNGRRSRAVSGNFALNDVRYLRVAGGPLGLRGHVVLHVAVGICSLQLNLNLLFSLSSIDTCVVLGSKRLTTSTLTGMVADCLP